MRASDRFAAVAGCALLALVLALGGCGGDGTDGPTGGTGGPGPDVPGPDVPGPDGGGTPDGGGNPRPDGGTGGPGGGSGDGGLPDAGSPDAGSTGEVRSVQRFGDGADDGSSAVAHDPRSGDVVVALRADGRGEVRDAPLVSEPGAADLALVRLRADGRPVWVRTFRITNDASSVERQLAWCSDLAFAADGSLWALLRWRFGSMDVGTGPLPMGDYLVKLSPSGATQAVLAWWGADGLALPARLAATADGGVVVTGQFDRRVDFGGGPVDATRTEQGTPIFTGFVARYGPRLDLRWVRTFGGRQDFGAGLDVAVAEGGDVLVGGVAEGEARFADSDIPGPAGADERRGVLARLGPEGQVRWVKTVGSLVRQVAFSRLGTAVAAGEGDPVRWAGQTLVGVGDAFLVTAEVNGAGRWARAFRAFGVTGLGVDDAGSARLLVCGHSLTNLGGGLPPPSNSPERTFLARINLDGAWRWTRELPPGVATDSDELDVPRLAVTGPGAAWVLAPFSGPWNFGGTSLSSRGAEDVYLLQLGP